MNIFPIILAGGIGARLWPLSRKSYPKQFSNFVGDESLFQKCVLRVSNSSRLKFSDPIVMTNADFRFIVAHQLNEIGIKPESIIIEPESKNTAAAILAAAMFARRIDPSAVILICPSDHLIPDNLAIEEAFLEGLKETGHGKIITFGAIPSRAETGYGYLKVGGDIDGSPIPLEKFVEKPTELHAKEMLKSGNYFWNMGIFMAKVETIIKSFEMFCSDLITPVSEAVRKGQKDLNFFKLNNESWQDCKKISIDYAVMEHAENIMMVPYHEDWSDLGDWNSLRLTQKGDENGVVRFNGAIGVKCKDSILYSENENQNLICLGLENIAVVSMQDNVLVASLDRVQEVGEVVKSLSGSGVKKAETFPKLIQSWGSCELLSEFDELKVRLMRILPGLTKIVEPHELKLESWIILKGRAKVIIGKEETLLSKGQSIDTSLGIVNSITNIESYSLILIKLST